MPNGQLLIIRHAESEKNLAGQFAGDAKTDQLTQGGRKRAEQIGVTLRQKLQGRSISVYIANSGRARQTAEAMFGCDHYPAKIMDDLGSMESGPYAGMNDNDLRIAFPEFFADLQLFRTGILSGYDIRAPAGSDSWHDFERRVLESFSQILADPAELRVIVCHRSAMMVLLVNLSRNLMEYPSTHFGFVSVPPLSCAIIDYEREPARISVDEPEVLLRQIFR